MRLSIYLETVTATGCDPEVAPVLPEVPHWMTRPDDRAVRVADADTGLIPAVTGEAAR